MIITYRYELIITVHIIHTQKYSINDELHNFLKNVLISFSNISIKFRINS